ncbi:hypothetical protein [Cellulomonas fimi]|uniref:Uncharacterized protein n=1 Tax=Cellulomonas fimi TaxID=1708 RepID=A0A7Y0LXX4_CELFI|nr:hypothetical protein [Cellulomonas fimi]NMR20213.1 hypothetical protein [Cellulomonas fimi]
MTAAAIDRRSLRMIVPDAIPGSDLDADAILDAAVALTTRAHDLRDGGAAVVLAWRGLSSCYQAPEAPTLWALMDPVEPAARWVGDRLGLVAGALRTFAEDVRPITRALRTLQDDARAFVRLTTTTPDWQFDQALVDRNTDLRVKVDAQQIALWDAERRCANLIVGLDCLAGWRPMTSVDDPWGYGVEAISPDIVMPWGPVVPRRDPCAKAALDATKRLLWDGIVVDSLLVPLEGIVGLAGFGRDGFSLETAATGWRALGTLVGVSEDGVSLGTAGEAWTAVGKAAVGWDLWADDPARAAGNALFTVMTLGAGVVTFGATAGVKAGTTAVGTTSRTARAAAAVSRVGDLVDPLAVTLAVASTGRAALPRLGELAKLGGGSPLVPDLPTTPSAPGSQVPRPPVDIPPPACQAPAGPVGVAQDCTTQAPAPRATLDLAGRP